MTTDIQYFAAHYVAFKDNLNEQEKGFLIKWIKENSDDEIKSLLITGDYKFQQESVDQFDEVFWVLNEASYATLAKMGIQGRIEDKGIVNIDKLLKYIRNVKTDQYMQGIKSANKNMLKFGGNALAVAAISALVITISYKVYKNYLSKAAKACKGRKGIEKQSCMNKFKRDAMKKQVADLSKGSQACVKTKDPAKCKAKIGKKIQSVKAKLGAL